MFKTLGVVVLAMVAGCWTEEPVESSVRNLEHLQPEITFGCFTAARERLDINPGAPVAIHLTDAGVATVELTTGLVIEGPWALQEGWQFFGLATLYPTIDRELWEVRVSVSLDTGTDTYYINYEMENYDRDAECWGTYRATP